MQPKPIKSWTDVHQLGETPTTWNKGKRSRAVRPAEEAATMQRFKERRKRDAAQALAMGVSLGFGRVADNYINLTGEFSRG